MAGVDDGLAFVRSWGFSVADIAVPTFIWHGSEDLFVPLAHGQWLAGNVPGAMAHLLTGEGHLSLAIGALDAMLAKLVEDPGAGRGTTQRLVTPWTESGRVRGLRGV